MVREMQKRSHMRFGILGITHLECVVEPEPMSDFMCECPAFVVWCESTTREAGVEGDDTIRGRFRGVVPREGCIA